MFEDIRTSLQSPYLGVIDGFYFFDYCVRGLGSQVNMSEIKLRESTDIREIRLKKF